MKKFITTAALMTSIALTAGACGQSADTAGPIVAPGPSALTSADGVVPVSIWHGLGGPAGTALDALVDEFNSKNSGKIKVTATYQGNYADLLAKYTAAVRSKSAPTVLLAGDVATGFLTDVAQHIPAADMSRANPTDLPLDGIVAAGKNYYTVDGTLQAVPMNMSTPVLWVNRDVLRAAGITDLSTLSSIPAVAAAARKVTAATGVKGFVQIFDDWWIEQMTAAAGQDFCTPGNGRSGAQPTGITINTGPAREAITAVADLYTSGVGLDAGTDGNTAVAAFAAGRVAMMFNSSGSAGAIKKSAKFDYVALPFPVGGPAAKSGTVIGGSALWLGRSGSSAAQVAGWKLESFLTSAAAQESFSQATGYVPVNTAVADAPGEKAYIDANPDFKVFADQVGAVPTASATAGCVTGAMTAIRTAVTGQIQLAYQGSKPVGAALDQAVSDAAGALVKYREQSGR